ncbi:MAG: hypothetical protein O9296_16065 [Novosphingobium sp.]|jgi:hypothetical protein|nr:hypothetical protein [Novosphingobium sp.]
MLVAFDEWRMRMANSIDRLFERVLSRLPDLGIDTDPAWPDLDEDFDDAIDNPPETDNDDLRSYEDYTADLRRFDGLRGTIAVAEPKDEDKDLVEGGIRSRGFEAIAFYKSKRFQSRRPFVGRWGIFYLYDGLSHIAWQISQSYPGYADPQILARDFLRAHEHFHFQADIQTLMLEATLGRHLYIPTRQRFRRARSHFVEEAIANRQAYDWAKRMSVGLEEYARDFMLCQPNAYARFLEPIPDLNGEWMANVVDGQPPNCPPRYDLGPWVQNTPKEFMRRSLCPEWVIFPRRLSDWIDPACITPPVSEIVDGDKVVKVLSKKLRNLQQPWENTKVKLRINKDMPGLNFKPWKLHGPRCYSVKVDEGNRAHLENLGSGKWLAYEIGGHKELGHG